MGVSDVLTADFIDFSWGVETVRNELAYRALQIGSYLTDPGCKVLELYRRSQVVDILNPDGNALCILAQKVGLYIGMAGLGLLSVMTTLPGLALRAIGELLQTAPFVHWQLDPEKVLPPDRAFTLLSWNICGPSGGFSISDGGVMPWAFRIDDLLSKIEEKNADVNCFYEVFDINMGEYMCRKLQEKGYTDFYFHIGPKAVGVSSGILVASKYKINNGSFTPFPEETLVGRTKSANKGVFAFDIESGGQNFARIFSTHLQHSHLPQFPIQEEVAARKEQMKIIVDKVNAVRDRCVVVTGDLNLDDDEYRNSSWQNRFQKGDRYAPHQKTWGGDSFCAKMMGIRPSGPLNLDHTIILRGSARSIETTIVETGYDAAVFTEKALSDHAGLFTRICA